MYCFEKQVLSISDYKALLKCPNILEDCYDEWLKTDANFNEVLEFAVENSIEHIKEDYKKELKSKNKEAR